MWSTVTSTPTREPQSLAQGSNQVSCAGTKWLHIRIDIAPESADRGSTNVSAGAPWVGAGASPPESPPPHAAKAPPGATRPLACKNRRRSNRT